MLTYFCENLLRKIEPSEITSFFYSTFFNFGGGGVEPPAYATEGHYCYNVSKIFNLNGIEII